MLCVWVWTKTTFLTSIFVKFANPVRLIVNALRPSNRVDEMKYSTIQVPAKMTKNTTQIIKNDQVRILDRRVIRKSSIGKLLHLSKRPPISSRNLLVFWIRPKNSIANANLLKPLEFHLILPTLGMISKAGDVHLKSLGWSTCWKFK